MNKQNNSSGNAMIVSLIVIVGIFAWYFLANNSNFSLKSGNNVISGVNGGNNITNSTSTEKITGEKIFGVTGDGATAEQIITYAKDLGFKSVRLAGPLGINWNMITTQGWINDDFYKKLNDNGLEISVLIVGGNPVADNKLADYANFVKSAAERYPYIKYWEIDNEPDLNLSNIDVKGKAFEGNISETPDYALMLKTAYGAIKSVNPNAKVAIAGMAYNLNYYEAIFKELEKLKVSSTDKFFDTFNFHYYGSYDQYTQVGQNMPSGEKAATLGEIKVLLDKYGYGNIEIILTETGTWSGIQNTPAAQNSNVVKTQTEAQQAASLFKRYIYTVANGVDRVYWFAPFIATQSGALISSDSKKLSYYTYKFMTEKLGTGGGNKVETISESNGVNVYKFTINDKPIWIAWNDNSANQNVNIDIGTLKQVKITEAIPKYNAGNNVVDYNSSFNTGSGEISGGELAITLGESPVYIEQSSENFAGYQPTIFSQVESGTTQQQVLPAQNIQQNQRPQGYCGDDICGPAEQANPALCPQDCNK